MPHHNTLGIARNRHPSTSIFAAAHDALALGSRDPERMVDQGQLSRWDADAEPQRWVAVAAAGRFSCSPKGRAFAVQSIKAVDPWAWLDESRARFDRLAFEGIGARDASEWVESEVGSGCARMALLARSWGKRELLAFDLMERAGREALDSMGASVIAWAELPGADWGGTDIRQVSTRACDALDSCIEAACIRRAISPATACAGSARLWSARSGLIRV